MLRPAFIAFLLSLSLGAARAAPVTVQLNDAKGRPVADGVVAFIPLGAPAQVTPPAAPLEIVQQGQEFIPRVTAVVVGTAVSFPNRDTVQHHVYSLSPPKKFELPLYAGEAKAPVVFDQPGVVALGCNIHDWMSAYVVVLTTPWFAQSGADGLATVAALPDGRSRIEVWHARLARVETRECTVGAALVSPLVFTLTLKADHRIRRHAVTVPGSYH